MLAAAREGAGRCKGRRRKHDGRCDHDVTQHGRVSSPKGDVAPFFARPARTSRDHAGMSLNRT
jgi:hypothetical protein